MIEKQFRSNWHEKHNNNLIWNNTLIASLILMGYGIGFGHSFLLIMDYYLIPAVLGIKCKFYIKAA